MLQMNVIHTEQSGDTESVSELPLQEEPMAADALSGVQSLKDDDGNDAGDKASISESETYRSPRSTSTATRSLKTAGSSQEGLMAAMKRRMTTLQVLGSKDNKVSPGLLGSAMVAGMEDSDSENPQDTQGRYATRPTKFFGVVKRKDKTSCHGLKVYHPHCGARLVWDLMTILFMIYLLIGIPVRLCYPDAEVEPFSFWGVIMLLIDLFFLCDIGVNFKTAYFNDEEILVVDPETIARKYVFSWLVLDLITSIPLEHILFISGMDEEDIDGFGVLSLARVLRITKYARVARLFRVSKVFQITDRWDDHNFLIAKLFKWAQFAVLAFIAIHICACTWMGVAMVFREDGVFSEHSWPSFIAYEFDPNDTHFAYLYLVTAYWAVICLTTVGFGDITPHNSLEILITMFISLMGTVAFAYIMATVSSYIEASSQGDADFTEKMNQLQQFLKYKKIPDNLKMKVNRHFHYLWDHNAPFFEQEETWIAHMPVDLQTEVIDIIYQDSIVSKDTLFSRNKKTLERDVSLLFPYLVPMQYVRNQTAYQKNELADAVYVVVSGEIYREKDDGTLDKDHPFGPGSHFGEFDPDDTVRRAFTMRVDDIAAAKAEALAVPKALLADIKVRYPLLFNQLTNSNQKPKADNDSKHSRTVSSSTLESKTPTTAAEMMVVIGEMAVKQKRLEKSQDIIRDQLAAILEHMTNQKPKKKKKRKMLPNHNDDDHDDDNHDIAVVPEESKSARSDRADATEQSMPGQLPK